MSMAAQGKRFYINPAKTEARWLAPLIQQHLFQGWRDVTDLSAAQLLAHIQGGEEQLDLFAQQHPAPRPP